MPADLVEFIGCDRGANADGTGVNQSLTTGITDPGGVAVDGTHVYWVNDIPQSRA